MIDGFSEAFLAILSRSWTNITLSSSESNEGVKYRLTVRHINSMIDLPILSRRAEYAVKWWSSLRHMLHTICFNARLSTVFILSAFKTRR